MHRSYVIATALVGLGFAAVLLLVVPDLPVIPVLVIAAGVMALFFLFWIFGTYLPLRRFHPVQERFGFSANEEAPSTLTGCGGGIRFESSIMSFAKAAAHGFPSLSSSRIPPSRQSSFIERVSCIAS